MVSELRFEGAVDMSKGVDEQNVPIETRARSGRKHSRSRDMLSALESHMVYLEESMGENVTPIFVISFILWLKNIGHH